MKKVTATAIYKNNRLYNLTANYKGDFITLVEYDEHDTRPYNYTKFNDLYKSILNILKNNGFYCGYWTQYEQKLYDIQFINLETPTKIEKFAYIMEG